MQKFLLPILLILTHTAFGQEVTFKLTGKFINKTNSKTLYVGGVISDSIKLQSNNSFTYTGKLEEQQFISLSTKNSYPLVIWVNSGDIQIVLEEDLGPEINSNGKCYLKIDSMEGPYETITYNNINETYVKILSKYQSHTPKRIDSVMREFSPLIMDCVQKFPNSYISPFLVRIYDLDTHDKKALFDIMGNNPNTSELKNLENQIKRSTLLEKGKIVENFTQKSSTGQPFELYSVKKPFILLEFWSSNCIPCRRENPYLIKVYSKYHSKSLEIVGISMDDDNAAWTQAVQKDGLSWINVSDLSGWQNKIAQKYFIDYMPFNILLDSSYAILATNIGHTELTKIIDTYQSN